MGSSCSSAQKKKDKEGKNGKGGQSPIGDRRCSTESIPYAPASSRRPSFDPTTAPATVPEQAESPAEQPPQKTPVDAALSSISAGGSSCSPPPGTSGTPIVKDAPSLETIGLPDLQNFPDQIRSLVLGRVNEVDLQPPLQEITLYVAADYYDSVVERDALVERVFPSLRRYAAERGYELNVTDLHWGIPGVGLVDHGLPPLCMNALARGRSRRRLLTLVIFNDNIGATLLPTSLPKPHFESGIELVSDEGSRELLKKWYTLDAVASPMVYALRPVIEHLPEIGGNDPIERGKAFYQWKEEAEKMIEVLSGVLPDGQRQKNLTSVFQEEIKFIVTDDPQEAKRVLWMQRRFTHKPCSGDKPSPSTRKIDQSKIQLEDYLPDTQKLVFYVKWHEEGLDPVNFAEDEQYISEMCDSLKEELTKLVDGLLEEDFLEEAREVYRGIEKQLYVELIQQCRAAKELSQFFIEHESSLVKVKEYLSGTSPHPLIVSGPAGCGKTCLVAKLTEVSSSYFPSACVVSRLVGLTGESSTQQQLLRSITEQCCALYGEHPAIASSGSGLAWDNGLGSLLGKVSELRPLILLLDGVDQLASYSGRALDWLPRHLPPHVRLVLTLRQDSEELAGIKNMMEGCDTFLALSLPSAEDANLSVNKVLERHKKRLSSQQRDLVTSCLKENTSNHYSNLLALLASTLPDFLNQDVQTSTEGLVMQYLAHVERRYGSPTVVFVLGLLVSAKHGISESEMLDIISCEDPILSLVFFGEDVRVRRIPAVLWAALRSALAPLLRSQVMGGRTLTMLSCEAHRAVVKKYLQEKGHTIKASAQVLVDYFCGKWADSKAKPIAPDSETSRKRFVLEQPLAYGPNPNRRKLEELPFQVLQVNDSIRDNFLLDATWLLYKFCGSDPYQLLEDLLCCRATITESDPQLDLLENTVQLASYALRNDGSQFFAQMYGRLRKVFMEGDTAARFPALKSIFDASIKPPLSSLLPIGECLTEPQIDPPASSNNCSINHNASPESPGSTKSFPFTGLYTVKGDPNHVVSISEDKNEIVVWNVYEQSAVRRMTHISQPKDIKMIDQHRALVLCNRELKVYNLDQGTLAVKLKGVMNQKMAYYGLHSENYAVALSRNRMYVNMTNLETGDLETTFKVGEDRFLNSLLVSANGRICVCGDETQKPFPLLVWDLTSRKLVYDLRIPHHEFVTRLSAISDDGHYVVSVCRELHDASPNFVIVYDLQSGTLFKKWKPESGSVSIAISSQGGCVLNGLANSWVLVWDLSTGARRFTLRGHSAPADQIRMEESGKRCLSYDSRGRDRSVRVWDVTKGECMAVFTPDHELSCCELTLDGKAVLLGLRGFDTITTLLLCQESTVEEETPPPSCYGNEQLKHKEFDMSHEG